MSLDGSNIPNSSIQIYYPKYTTLATDTIALHDIFHNYLQDSFFEYVICETCSSVSSEMRKSAFTV